MLPHHPIPSMVRMRERFTADDYLLFAVLIECPALMRLAGLPYPVPVLILPRFTLLPPTYSAYTPRHRAVASCRISNLLTLSVPLPPPTPPLLLLFLPFSSNAAIALVRATPSFSRTKMTGASVDRFQIAAVAGNSLLRPSLALDK